MTDVRPIQVTCPTCNAQPWKPCTVPTNVSRREVTWFHTAREEAASHYLSNGENE